MINELTALEYREFQKEYNEYLDGISHDEYIGTNTQLKALEEVIKNAPTRTSNTAENQRVDAPTTHVTNTKQKLYCLVA